MGRPSQLLLSTEMKQTFEHGGSLSVGKRKGRRPFSAKRPIHLVLRASGAVGERSFLRRSHSQYISLLLKTLSSLCGVTIYQLAVNGNHLHMVIRARDRRGFQKFLRVFAGKVAQKVTGSQKTRKLAGRFWDHIPFTRLLSWGRDFFTAKAYVEQNEMEANGTISYQPRKQSTRRPKSYAAK
jgi:REP element-mobilizing transposase RayT